MQIPFHAESPPCRSRWHRHSIGSPCNITTLKGSYDPRCVGATPSGSNETLGSPASVVGSALAHGYCRPAFRAGLPSCFAILMALGGGTAGAGSTPHAHVLTQLCTTDAECDDGQFCNGWETCDSNGQCAAGTPGTCCSDRSHPTLCSEALPRCDPDSENYGAGCQSDADCRYGRCQRCQDSCTFDADCNDEFRCNGTERCLRTCLGGPNDGNPCTSNANCTPGTCIGQCQPGVNPCGGADCAERKCQNVVPTQYCHVDSDCPLGSPCVSLTGTGFVCFTRVCGDGIISGSEQCDPNANLSNPMPGQLANGCFTGSTCLPDSDPQKCTCTAFCGNNNLEQGEECDGPSMRVCPGRCQTDCTCAPSSCGNGIVEYEYGENVKLIATASV